MPGQACRDCVETQSTDSRWGVLVFSGTSTGVFNIEGCVDDALDEVAEEKANAGTGSCGDLLHASYGCQNFACAACVGNADDDTCVQTALHGGCKSYDTPIESSSGPCAPLLADVVAADVLDCFPDPQIAGQTQQEVDWLTRMVGYMCGP